MITDPTNHSPTDLVMFNFLYVGLSILVALYLLAKIWDWHHRQHIYNTQTDQIVTGSGFFEIYKFFVYEYLTGQTINLQRDIFHPTYKHHELYSGWLGSTFILFVNDHLLAKHILQHPDLFEKDQTFFQRNHLLTKIFGINNVVSANGESWTKQRHAISPAFYSIENYIEIFKEKANLVLKSIVSESNNGIVSPITKYMQKMTLDVLGKAIFNYDFKSIQGYMGKDLDAYNYIIRTVFTLESFLIGNVLWKFGSQKYQKAIDAMNTLNILFGKMIHESKQKLIGGEEKSSMLDDLVEANMRSDEFKLTDDELRDNIWIFMIAGHETTSIAVSYVINLLGQHLDIQDRIRDEIEEHVGNHEISIENIKKCEYLDAVIKESMRLHPPIPNIPTKIASSDTKLGNWVIPKGTRIQINIYTIHQNETIYPDQQEFNPDRWMKHKIPSSAWIPFSAGSRVCVGNMFSLFEQKVFLIELLRKFQVERMSNKPIRPAKNFGLSGPEPADIKFTELK
jgi:cytochrome P450